jgi:hypothetical protein
MTVATRTPLNLCRGCDQDFASLRGFDFHLLGNPADGRSCMTLDEMEQRRWQKDDAGRWLFPAGARLP